MKVSILKRLEAIEKCVKVNDVPEIMVISFEADMNKYRCLEQYDGTPQKPGKHNITFVDDLEEIIIKPDFHGVILIDNMQKGEEGNFFSESADTIRKKAKLSKTSAFSLKEYDQEESNPLITTINIKERK